MCWFWSFSPITHFTPFLLEHLPPNKPLPPLRVFSFFDCCLWPTEFNWYCCMSLDGVIYWSMGNLPVAALWKIQLPLPQQPLTARGTSGRGEPSWTPLPSTCAAFGSYQGVKRMRCIKSLLIQPCTGFISQTSAICFVLALTLLHVHELCDWLGGFLQSWPLLFLPHWPWVVAMLYPCFIRCTVNLSKAL